jgi:steroid 5-alpha reductase family enzyme
MKTGNDQRCGAIDVVWGVIALLSVKAVLMSVKESIAIMLLLMLFVHSRTWGRM